jgi:Chaperone of endosialidase
MGRKNKNVMGGAMSGAAAGGTAAGPWGAAAGAILGGVMGAQADTDAAQLAPVVPQDVVDKLYAQANGNSQTIGELKGAQMYDKTLAQQIAAAKAQRGVNPGLLSRNVSRIAAEQSQANAQNAAILAADERNKAMAQYLQARQLNSQIEAQNLGFEAKADSQANNMLSAGFNSAASSLALGAQKRDAAAQQAKIDSDKEIAAETPYQDARQYSDTPAAKAQDLSAAYTMGATMRQTSDYGMKTKIKPESLKVTSDERQKDLIKSENLPANNNLQMQNQSAQQPQAMPTQAAAVMQPAQASPQASAPQVQAAAAPPAPGITAEMLQQAQRSSKGGGNIADIQNASNMSERGRTGPSADEIMWMTNDAQRRQARDMFGNVTRSDRENYAENMANWQAQQAAKNDAFDKEQVNVNEQNLMKDAQRTARLNRFYTGIDTSSTGAVASQYAPKIINPNADWQSAQNAQRAAGIGDQSSGYNYGRLAREVSPYAAIPMVTSDENQKQNKKVGGAADFNPKSFLDKLQAYSYEYKNSAKGMPGVDDGRHLGVMAQSLEKAGPVGESMVDEDAQGNKVVDYGAGFSAILASQAHLNERLKQLESKKKKV